MDRVFRRPTTAGSAFRSEIGKLAGLAHDEDNGRSQCSERGFVCVRVLVCGSALVVRALSGGSLAAADRRLDESSASVQCVSGAARHCYTTAS